MGNPKPRLDLWFYLAIRGRFRGETLARFEVCGYGLLRTDGEMNLQEASAQSTTTIRLPAAVSAAKHRFAMRLVVSVF